MHLLIDSDSLLYKAGFVVNEPGQEGLACWQLDGLVQSILQETGCESYQCYLTGKNNFRYKVYQDYKGNRINMARPIHLAHMTEHLVDQWGAVISDGKEADDDCGIALYKAEDEVVLAHIDKDLNMLAGRHYNYNKKEWYNVSEEQAMRHFFYQLIMGDKGDNIPGFDGLMRAVVPKKLQAHIDFIHETDDYDEMLVHVFEMYNEDWKRFKLSADCLWIWRKEEDSWESWQNPDVVNECIMMDSGQEDDSTASSQVSFDPGAESGLQNIAV